MKLVDPRQYWEKRLKDSCTLNGVGCVGLGGLFNAYLYKAKVRTLDRVARQFKISIRQKKVLDVGSGTGFWIDHYLSKGAKLIYGVDITSAAVRYLTEKYRNHGNVRLLKGDFSDLRINKKFDVVNAFDVAYHVINDGLFVKFIKNLCYCLKDGGSLIVSDFFKRDYRNRNEITHAKCRSLNAYSTILKAEGLEVLSVVPMYSILGNPFTGRRKLDETLSSLHSLSVQLYRRSKLSLELAYHIDSLLTKFKSFGISTQLLVAQKGVNNRKCVLQAGKYLLH